MRSENKAFKSKCSTNCFQIFAFLSQTVAFCYHWQVYWATILIFVLNHFLYQLGVSSIQYLPTTLPGCENIVRCSSCSWMIGKLYYAR